MGLDISHYFNVNLKNSLGTAVIANIRMENIIFLNPAHLKQVWDTFRWSVYYFYFGGHDLSHRVQALDKFPSEEGRATQHSWPIPCQLALRRDLQCFLEVELIIDRTCTYLLLIYSESGIRREFYFQCNLYSGNFEIGIISGLSFNLVLPKRPPDFRLSGCTCNISFRRIGCTQKSTACPISHLKPYIHVTLYIHFYLYTPDYKIPLPNGTAVGTRWFLFLLNSSSIAFSLQVYFYPTLI